MSFRRNRRNNSANQTSQDVDSDDESLVMLVGDNDSEAEKTSVEIETIVVRSTNSKLTRAEKERRNNFPSNILRRRKLAPLSEKNQIDMLLRLSKQRQFCRDIEGVSRYERETAKKLQPFPTVAEVQVFENLLAVLYNLYDRISLTGKEKAAVKIRAFVYIGGVALQGAQLIHNILGTHDKTESTKQRRNFGRDRRRKCFVSSKLINALGKHQKVDEVEMERLFSSLQYQLISETMNTKQSLVNLKKVFLVLNSICAEKLEEFHAARNLFQLVEEVDEHFVCVSRQEMNLTLQVLQTSLRKCFAIVEKSETDDFKAKSLAECLHELDAENLNFLYPYILPNVTFHNEKMMTGCSFSFVGYLEYTCEKFCALLTKQNFLTHLELHANQD